MTRKILVTGSSGFLGGALVQTLAVAPSTSVVAASRNNRSRSHDHAQDCVVGDINSSTQWTTALLGCEAVVHCAARVHVMHETVSDPLALFREVNTEGTLNLARQAAAAGVRRFIFISSIKVNGESTAADECFRADDTPQPGDPYGISKHEAEQGLLALAATCAMEVVIIRPVLVYGPGVKANFLQLMRVLSKGIPLPLGAIHNRRSLVSRDNLIDLITRCIDHPAAANQIFLVSDGEDLSTSDLARRLIKCLRSRTWLLPFPQGLMFFAARLLGRGAAARRVLGSLRVDISKNRELLGWTPPVSVDQSLENTVAYFRTMDAQ